MSSRSSRITQSTLRSLPKTGTDYFIRDTSTKGFHIKVSAAGKKTYQVEARLNGTGRSKKFKIGNIHELSLDEARDKARQALSKIRQGIDPLLEKRAQTHANKTLKQIINLYLDTRPLKQSTIEGYKYLTNKRLTQWLNLPVKDITKHSITDWYTREKTKRPTQTEQAFRFLNSVMNFAIALEVIAVNPCSQTTASRIRYKVKRRSTHLRAHLCHLVHRYDHLIPFFAAGKCSQFTDDTLRFCLYGGSTPAPVELITPTDEDPAWEAQRIREFWDDYSL